MTNEEILKQLEEGIREAINQYVGSPATQLTAHVVEAEILDLLHRDRIVHGGPIPVVKADIHCNQVYINFFDPETNEPVVLSDWYKKRGFYV